MERENIQKLKNELRDAFALAKDSLPIFRSAITNKNAVIFLGNTRSGKSTLVNYIIASRLISFKIRKNVYKVGKVNKDEPGPHIGQESVSDTTIPGIYYMNNYNTVAVDAPGFSDNRGEVQDIINAVFINQIKFARTCKFVLVSDINDIIGDNIGGFLSLIAKTNKLMPNLEKLRQSSVLVITKDNNEYTRNEIAELLQQKILNVCGLNISPQNMDLINHFAQQDELIGLFRMPSEEGEVIENLDVNIEDAISSTRSVPMKEVQSAISEQAQVILLEIFQEFSDNLQLKAELDKLIDPYKNYFKVNQYIYASTDGELKDTTRALNGLTLKLLDVQNNKLPNIRTINALLSSIKDLVPLDRNRDVYKTLTLFAMLNDVGLIKQPVIDQLVKKYKQALKVLLANIEGCIKKIQEEKETRKKLDLEFSTDLTMAKVSAGAAVGGALLQGFTMRAVATRLLGAVTGIGTVLTVIGAAASFASYMNKKEETEKRIEARISQGRPVPT